MNWIQFSNRNEFSFITKCITKCSEILNVRYWWILIYFKTYSPTISHKPPLLKLSEWARGLMEDSELLHHNSKQITSTLYRTHGVKLSPALNMSVSVLWSALVTSKRQYGVHRFQHYLPIPFWSRLHYHWTQTF